MKIDVHQHLWTEPLIEALASRRELPFVRVESGLTVLYLAGERPYVIDRRSEAPGARAELIERDGLDRALLCLSSPVGIERLPRPQALALIDAYHDGALAADGPFGVWGALALDEPEPDDVEDALERGCVGISIPAGAIADVDALASMYRVLERLEQLDAPLLVHPGPGRLRAAERQVPRAALCDPLWWPALTSYVSDLQSSWLAFNATGRSAHPRLRIIFTMLAGLAPLHSERLRSRGGRVADHPDPLVFYETSSYGAAALGALRAVVGPEQILYGSDRPVVEPRDVDMPGSLDWGPVSAASERALCHSTAAVQG
jgi:6-methylsalicylate decarboxylase